METLRRKFSPSELKTLPTGTSLSNYLASALQNSPSVRAGYYDWIGEVNQITIERSLPDPRLSFATDIQGIIMGLMPGLMIEFPGPGKLKGAAAVAKAESDVTYFKFKEEVLRAAFEVKAAYYGYQGLEQKITIYTRLRDLMAQVAELARAQAETGKAGLQDVLRSEIELEMVATELATLVESRRAFRARFKAALGLGPSEPEVHLPNEFLDTEESAAYDLSQALVSNPTVAQMQAEVRVAEAALFLARRGKIPDFSIGLEADAWAAPTIFTPELSITLPIWKDKISAQITQAQARKAASEQRLTGAQITLAVELAEKTFVVKEADLAEDLLNTKVLPRAEQLLEVLRAAYSTGRASFLDLREAQRGLLQFHLQQIDASASKKAALAQLSLLIAGVAPASFPVLPVAEEPKNKPLKSER